MIFSRRALSLSSLGVVLAGAVLVACADGGRLVGPPEPEKPVAPDTSLLSMQCEVDLQTKTLSCGQPGPAGESRKLIVGGQNVFVRLAASNFATTLSGSPSVADTLAMDVTIENLIPQALGVLTDGTPDAANGVRVFFFTGPVAVPSGVASVEDEDGSDTFLASLTPFYRYPQVIQPLETSAARRWKLAYTPGATNVRFSVYVDAQVQYPDGWVRITPEADTLQIGGTVTLSGTPMDVVGRTDRVSQTLTWSSSNDAIATVDASTGLVTAVARGSALVTATNGEQSGTATIVVNNAPMAVADTVDALGNLTVPVDSAQGLLANDTDANGDGLAVVAGTFPTDRGGSVTLNANGSLQYLSPAGFEMGYDSVQYTVSDGVQSASAYLHINVGARVWYVQPGAAAPGDGTDARPFDALVGVDSIAGADETIYVLAGGSTPVADEGITLEAGQSLVGQALVAPVTTMLNDRSVVLLATGDAALVRRTTAGNTVRLGTNNTISGLLVGSTAGAAISGASFGTLSVDSVSVDAVGGPALDLETGTLAVSLDSLASTGSATNGVRLVGTDGTLTATTGTVDGTFLVTGGSVSVTYPGTLSETDGALVGVNGTHTGTLVFSGAVGATGGPGLQFNDADGTYTFSGTTTLAGGDAGIDVVGGSAGTFSFGASTTITNPSGDALVVNGSAPTLTYAGSISANAGRPVLVDGLAGGTVELSGAIAATGLGILVQNNTAGAVRFTGSSKSLSTATNPAVVLANNGTASTTFAGGGLEITTTTGAGFLATGGGLVQVTGLGNRVVTTTGTPVTISATTIDGSGVTFAQVSANGAANGIVLSNTGATNGFQVVGDGSGTAGSGGIIQNTTGVPVSLTSTDSTVLRNLTLSGAGGIEGTGFGALTVENVAVTSVGAPALNLATGEVTGTFSSVTASGATNAVNLSAVNGFFAANGGTLTGGAGAAFNLSGGDVGVVWNGSISQANDAPLVSIDGGHNVGTVTFQLGTLSATNGSGVRFGNADGIYNFNGTLNLAGGDAGIDIAAAAAGDVNVVPAAGHTASILNPTGVAVDVAGGAADLLFNGSVRQDNAAALLNVTGGHTGTLAFQTGTVNANGGTGLQFTDADGTYNFFGSLDLSGGDAGIDIGALSAGTVNVTPAGAHTAQIVSPTGAAISIAGGSADLTFNGNVTQASNAALLSVAGGHSGTVSFPGTLAATNGTGLLFDNADGSYAFSGTTTLANSVGGADAGIDVTNNSSGTFSFNANTSVTNPANQLFTISNSAPTFTYSGSFTKNNNAVTGILMQSNTGGSVTFNGDRATETKLLSTGTATAVNMTNSGTSVLFSGGGLSINTTSGNGLSATSGGTVQVTGAVNTIASGTGTALNVQSTTIGGSGLSFQSISANGGSNGIVLIGTGSTNGLQVTGDGATVGSGGSIVNMTGADGAVAGSGVYLNGATNVNLNWMQLSGHANFAIFGNNVAGFNMNRTRITGTNGTSGSGDGEGGVYFYGLTGSASVTSSYIEGGRVRNFAVVNTSGTLNRLTMTSDTIGFDGVDGSDGIFLQADNSANTGVPVTFNATVQNSRFLGSRGDQIQMSARGTSVSDFVFTGNTLTNNHPSPLPQNFGVAISGGGLASNFNPTLTYNVSNNSIRDAGSTAISVGKGGVGAGSFTGTISNNVIGVSGVANSGAAQGSAIVVDIVGGGSHTSTITNNTIRQFTNYGILAQSGNTTAGGGQGYLTLTIQGNNIAEPSPASAAALFPTSGIRVMTGTNSGDTSKNCVTLGGTLGGQANTVVGTGTNGGQDLRLFQRFTTILGVPGYAGANNDNAAMNAFLSARNTAGGISATNNTAAGGSGYSGSCPT